MKKHIIRIAIFSVLMQSIYPSLLIAGIGSDMTNFFNKFGAVSNSTKGSAYHDQQGGYYTGGSFFMRSPTRNTQPISVTPPGMRMGCGGIDLWTGGFSFINMDQLKGALNNIISNSVNYAFMLAVETYAPVVHGIMQQMNKLANDINSLNIGSCEAAAGIVGSVWPKSDLGSQNACRMISSYDGKMADWVKGRHGCSKNPTSTLDKNTKEQLVGECNVAWVVLEKVNLDINKDNSVDNPINVIIDEKKEDDNSVSLKEIFMTFSGTIVRKKNTKGDIQKIVYPALGDRDSFLKSMMSGGQVTVYKCKTAKDPKCLDIDKKSITIPPNSALQVKITNILEQLAAKIQDDDGSTTQTPQEESLMNATSLPLYKFMNVTTAYQKGRAPIAISEYAEIIALDVVVTYVNDVLMTVREAASNIKDMQFTDEEITPFLEEIRETQKSLGLVRGSVMKKFEQLLGFIQKTQIIEAQLHHMMGAVPPQG